MKRRKQSVPYLKLVSDQKKESIKRPKASGRKLASRPKRRGVRQLSLPYADHLTLIAANVIEMHVAQFKALVSSIGPKWVVDTRVAPRLDNLVGTRKGAFQLFHDIGSEYLDLGLATYRAVDANPAYWAHELGHAILNSGKAAGPFLVLFDNSTLMEASYDEIADAFDKVLGVKISVSIVA